MVKSSKDDQLHVIVILGCAKDNYFVPYLIYISKLTAQGQNWCTEHFKGFICEHLAVYTSVQKLSMVTGCVLCLQYRPRER